MLLVWFILIPVISGVLCYALNQHVRKYVIIFIQLVLIALVIHCFARIDVTGSIGEVLGANDSILGIELKADRISIVMVGLAIFLFTINFIYTFSDKFFDKKFTLLFMVLQGLLCGIFLSDDLFNIFVLVEVSTVIVAILIMFKKDEIAIYDGIVYLFSQIVCMAFYLFGIGYLYKIFGVLSMDAIRAAIPSVEASQLVLPFTFILTSICLKCAFFPLFSWLPRAHGTPSAPSTVSAILSGLYVKNGIYLFLRFTLLFAPVLKMSDFFMVVSVVTAICGFLLAITQKDIKLILAYHTISQMGLISIGLNFPNETAWWGSVFHILNHALFKSLLFLTCGNIIDAYGTRDIREIRGVMKRMPVVGIATLMGILGITGAPLFNGSISKYFIQYGTKGTILEYVIILINTGTIISFVKYASMLWGDGGKKIKTDFNKTLVILLLGVLCLGCGIFSPQIIRLLFGIDVSVNSLLYLEKIGIYVITVALSLLLYKFVLSRSKKIYALTDKALTFPQITSLMIVFFIVLLIATSMVAGSPFFLLRG